METPETRINTGFFRILLVEGLHCREQQHVAYGGAVGKQHHKAVYSQAYAACGGHAVLQSGAEGLVYHHGLVVALGALHGLLYEAAPLIDGVVQLGEGVGVLVAGDEQLKALGKPRVVGLALGQGGYFHRIVYDEGGLDKGVLHKRVEHHRQYLARSSGLVLYLYAKALCLGTGLFIGQAHKVHAGLFPYGVVHGNPLKGSGKVYLAALIGYLCPAAVYRLAAMVYDALGKLHHSLVVGVCLIQLNGCKLGVMGSIHALVAEYAAYLIYPLKASHYAHLQMQLGSYTHVHIYIQRIVVGYKGPRGGAGSGSIEYGGFYLYKALIVEPAAHLGYYYAALYEGIADLGVHDKVYEALTVAKLGVLEAMELLRQRPEGLAQKLHLLRVYGYLAGAGLEYPAHHADYIAYVEGLELGVAFLAYVVPLDVYLYVALIVQYVGKAGLAHNALGHHPARHAHRLILKGFVIRGYVGAVKLLVVAHLSEWILTCVLKCLQLVPTYLQKLRKLRLRHFLCRLHIWVLCLFFHRFLFYPYYLLMFSISNSAGPPGV